MWLKKRVELRKLMLFWSLQVQKIIVHTSELWKTIRQLLGRTIFDDAMDIPTSSAL